MPLELQQKTFFLLTGASRGIGKTLALRLAEQLKDNSVVVLLARNLDKLNKTKSEIDALGKKLHVQVYSIDLAQATAAQFKQLLQEALENADAAGVDDFERALIVHNAGTVGDVSLRATDNANVRDWSEFYHLNVFSVIALNCEFFSMFATLPKLVVNLSTKAATVPFSSMSWYCTSRAARDMYFRVLALEQQKDAAAGSGSGGTTLVLNYGPGVIDTDMTLLVQQQSYDSDLAASFKQQRDSKSMLTTEQTVKKLLQVLKMQTYKSGDYVDYWD